MRRRERWRPFFAVGHEAARYAILRRLLRWGPFFFLFSRVSGPAVLNHKTRELIYAHIQQQPGAYYRSILRELGLTQGTLSHHLYSLERADLIKRQRHGLRVRFFPGLMGTLKTRPLNTWQYRVLSIVRARPGLSQVDVADQLGITKQALRYHVGHLRKAGLLDVTSVGRSTELTLPPGVWSRVNRCATCGTPFHAQPGALAIRCPACHVPVGHPRVVQGQPVSTPK